MTKLETAKARILELMRYVAEARFVSKRKTAQLGKILEELVNPDPSTFTASVHALIDRYPKGVSGDQLYCFDKEEMQTVITALIAWDTCKPKKPETVNYPLRLSKEPDGSLEWRDDNGRWDCPNHTRLAIYGLAVGIAPLSDTSKELTSVLNREIAADVVKVLSKVHRLNEDSNGNNLAYWLKRKADSQKYADEHPGNPTNDAELELCDDWIKKLSSVGNEENEIACRKCGHVTCECQPASVGSEEWTCSDCGQPFKGVHLLHCALGRQSAPVEAWRNLNLGEGEKPQYGDKLVRFFGEVEEQWQRRVTGEQK